MKALSTLLVAACLFFSCTTSEQVVPDVAGQSATSVTTFEGEYLVGNYTNLANHSSLEAEPETLTIKYEQGSFIIDYHNKIYSMAYDADSKYLGFKKDIPCGNDLIQQIRLFDNTDGTFGLYVNHYGSTACNGQIYVTSATYKKLVP